MENTCFSASIAAVTSISPTVEGAFRSASIRMPSRLLTTVTSVLLVIAWRRVRWLDGRVITSNDVSETV